MIGARLTMRAAVERNQNAAKDAWGQPAAPDFQSTGEPLPCFVYSNAAGNSGGSREIADGEKLAMVEDMRAMFALGADLLADDEIASVTDRQGVVIIPGRLQVLGPVEFKYTHLEAALRRVG